jgi:hypothetical protein
MQHVGLWPFDNSVVLRMAQAERTQNELQRDALIMAAVDLIIVHVERMNRLVGEKAARDRKAKKRAARQSLVGVLDTSHARELTPAGNLAANQIGELFGELTELKVDELRQRLQDVLGFPLDILKNETGRWLPKEDLLDIARDLCEVFVAAWPPVSVVRSRHCDRKS